ncbi:MAG: adenosylcobinamide-phosphate synthase CbiB [Pararhodobacter sp.]
MSFAGAMLIAMAIDAALGWPDALYRRIGHPVTWLGRLISALETRLNRDGGKDLRRRLAGVVTAFVVAGTAALAAWALAALMPEGWIGMLLTGVMAWPLVAIRSMHQHVAAVQTPLAQGDLPRARHAVSMIVGRDTTRLDEAGVARAATESLAENTSDGIVAPLFWGTLAGLPGIAAYKAINTLDSMIGHRTPRFEAFGWASARIDDGVNLIPARLTGVLFALVSGAPRAAMAAMRRDARKHRSPNAGWPEAALAGALGLRLSGPRVYADRVANEPWVNEQGRDPGARDLGRALALYRRAMCGLAVVMAALAGLGW